MKKKNIKKMNQKQKLEVLEGVYSALSEEANKVAEELQRALRKAPNYKRAVCGREVRSKIKKLKQIATQSTESNPR
jgi:hypothetical protein